MKPLPTLSLLFGAALSCAAFSACASAASTRTWGLEPAAAAEVARSCVTTLGLAPGDAWYDACADSLSRTLQSRAMALALDQAHEACARNAQPGTKEFNRCVVERDDAASDARKAAPAFVQAARTPANARARPPFRSLARPERLHRERLACADLGFDPVTPGFSSCVVSLSQAFFQLDNPR